MTRCNSGVDIKRKIVSLSYLLQLRHKWRVQERKVVLCQGCFDLLHVGHIHLLATAHTYGDVLIVAMNDDESVRKLKGYPRPLVPVEDRAILVASIEYVDYVTIFKSRDARSLVASLQPDVYVDDDLRGHQTAEARAVLEYGGQLAIVQRLPGYSTTNLIRQIINAYGARS